MGGRAFLQRRLFAALVLAVLTAAMWSSAQATTKWETKRWPWAGPGAAGAIPGGFDTLFIATAADTQRTVGLSTQDWDWTAVFGGNGTTTVDVAYLTLEAEVSNGAQDSLYFTIEKAGPKGYYTFNGALVASASTILIPNATNTNAATKVQYVGVIQGAANFTSAANALAFSPSVRLRIAGDSAGGKLSGCRLWITYPKRAQP